MRCNSLGSDKRSKHFIHLDPHHIIGFPLTRIKGTKSPPPQIRRSALAMSSSISTTIQWQSCFSARGADFDATFQCANLTVPLDYLNNTKKTTQIGVAKVHPKELENSLGPMFISGPPDLSYSPTFIGD